MSPDFNSNIIPANKVKIRVMTCNINISVILYYFLYSLYSINA